MTAITSGVDYKEAWKNNSDIFVLYRYQPSIDLAITAFLLFSFSTIIHIVQAWRTRTFYFIPFILGGLFELLGYLGRIFLHFHQYDFGIYVWQTLLLLLAPTLMAATVYMTLGEIIITTHAEHLSPVRTSWLTKIFVAGDIMSFLIQGGGMPPIIACLSQYMYMVNNNGPPAQASIIDAGRNIVVSGLILQVVFFASFIVTAVKFHLRLYRETHSGRHSSFTIFPHFEKPSTSLSSNISTTESFKTSTASSTVHIRYLNSLYITGALILGRSVFRIVEFMEGHAGKLMAVEWYLCVFDAAPILIVMLAFNIWHPGKLGAKGIVSRGEAFRLDDVTETGYDPKVPTRMEVKDAGRVGRMACYCGDLRLAARAALYKLVAVWNLCPKSMYMAVGIEFVGDEARL